MAAEFYTAELCALLSSLIRTMVDSPVSVTVAAVGTRGASIVIQLNVAKSDRGKLIGMNGRTARSLRVILATISAVRGHQYILDIGDGSETPA